MEEPVKPPYKRIYRSDQDRIIAGICGGLGEHFEIDPVIVRLVWIVLTFFGGSGIVLYLLAWLLIPRRPWSMPR
jgi:phage shock protein PspC (stress-responsive transcriptional regulator)